MLTCTMIFERATKNKFVYVPEEDQPQFVGTLYIEKLAFSKGGMIPPKDAPDRLTVTITEE